MKLFIAKGTLIVPVWKLAHFWPFALMEFTGVTLFMTGLFCPISLIYFLFIACKAKNSIFGCKPLLFVSAALRIDLSIPPREGSESSDVSFIVPVTILHQFRYLFIYLFFDVYDFYSFLFFLSSKFSLRVKYRLLFSLL